MITGNGIEIPDDLFKAIDRVHEEASGIYKGLDPEALELISSNRNAEKIAQVEAVRKAKIKNENLMNNKKLQK